MNGNWNGLLGANGGLLSQALRDVITQNFGKSKDVAKSSQWYSVFASGPGIFGLGSTAPGYDITNPQYINGGVNHFGSPFNFPEEFVSVYRLHPLVPDLLEYRDLKVIQTGLPSVFPSSKHFRVRQRHIRNPWGLQTGV